MTPNLIRFTQWGENPIVDASDWEPDGVTLHVRFCEGGGAYQFIGIPVATHPLDHVVRRWAALDGGLVRRSECSELILSRPQSTKRYGLRSGPGTGASSQVLVLR